MAGAAAPDGPPAAKRPRLATTAAARPPPAVTHTWTLDGPLTLESFTGAAPSNVWQGPVFQACGLPWQLFVQPNTAHRDSPNCNVFTVWLCLLDRTLAPVELGEATLLIHGIRAVSLRRSFFIGVVPANSSIRAGVWWRHTSLSHEATRILAGGQMVVTVTLRSRSFAEVAVPAPLAPALPALIAAALPAPGAAHAPGVDVVFRASNGEQIVAHSFILALHSSTLRARLWGGWGPLAPAAASVAQPLELAIPDGVDVAAFRRVVTFMYTDAVPELEARGLPLRAVRALLHAADYFDVPRLRELCAAELHVRLAPANAVATLKLAHALSCAPLLDATLRFIAANAAAVMSAPGWAELAHEVGLLQAVLSTMATGEPPQRIREPPPPRSRLLAIEPPGEAAGSQSVHDPFATPA